MPWRFEPKRNTPACELPTGIAGRRKSAASIISEPDSLTRTADQPWRSARNVALRQSHGLQPYAQLWWNKTWNDGKHCGTGRSNSGTAVYEGAGGGLADLATVAGNALEGYLHILPRRVGALFPTDCASIRGGTIHIPGKLTESTRNDWPLAEGSKDDLRLEFLRSVSWESPEVPTPTSAALLAGPRRGIGARASSPFSASSHMTRLRGRQERGVGSLLVGTQCRIQGTSRSTQPTQSISLLHLPGLSSRCLGPVVPPQTAWQKGGGERGATYDLNWRQPARIMLAAPGEGVLSWSTDAAHGF
ncbi:hypothetical protein NA56DRAFT_708148 [Hyaloscypha hepaticicola]|uniref:Uncharacterized protein n=1 Tax=Hyaloscypha hepaticicola TaxID=2082293 RepID=A0A2J6PSB5_9HELO|nr:hypothetical protein NA56DRAFT_708148 [Hyaloscypha hepaticicola]